VNSSLSAALRSMGTRGPSCLFFWLLNAQGLNLVICLHTGINVKYFLQVLTNLFNAELSGTVEYTV